MGVEMFIFTVYGIESIARQGKKIFNTLKHSEINASMK